MDIISAYREVGSYRDAAAISRTTAKTVKRTIARHESGGAPPGRRAREHNYHAVTELVAQWVEKTKGRVSAKRLLPAARAAGLCGSARNLRRLVGERKALWRNDHHRGRRPAVWTPVSIWSSIGVRWADCTCSAPSWRAAGSGSCASPMMSGPTRRSRCSRSALPAPRRGPRRGARRPDGCPKRRRGRELPPESIPLPTTST